MQCVVINCNLFYLFTIPFVPFIFFFSPSSSMQWSTIWSPLGLWPTLCPKETPSSWWGLCLFSLVCSAVCVWFCGNAVSAVTIPNPWSAWLWWRCAGLACFSRESASCSRAMKMRKNTFTGVLISGALLYIALIYILGIWHIFMQYTTDWVSG